MKREKKEEVIGREWRAERLALRLLMATDYDLFRSMTCPRTVTSVTESLPELTKHRNVSIRDLEPFNLYNMSHDLTQLRPFNGECRPNFLLSFSLYF